jgi:hypothetical protein
MEKWARPHQLDAVRLSKFVEPARLTPRPPKFASGQLPMIRSHPLLCRAAALALATLWSSPPPARADVLELTNGGRIEGRLVESSGDGADYVIEMAAGRVAIARSQVARAEVTSTAEAEYAAIARESPDSVEAHWKLYQWCDARQLRASAQKHLTRILELDPDHAEARTLLGFRNNNGEWQTRDELMAARGMVKYEGQYYTRQHIELLEQEKATKGAQVDWRRDLIRLRGWLTARDQRRAPQARAELQAIHDPMAAEPLVALARKEADLDLLRLWLEIAGRLNHAAATTLLVEYSLMHPNEEVRHLCLDYLMDHPRPGIATPYLQALNSQDNAVINRAAVALGRIGNPDTVAPLIDALVTMHKVESNQDPGQMAVSFGNGGGSMRMGAPPKPKPKAVRNPDVLAALVRLTGMSRFEYDQEAWRSWLAEQAKARRYDLRRDL